LISYCFTSHLRIFHLYGDATLPVKVCKILAYARRSGPFSREGSLSFHTCCDMGPWFSRSHPKDSPILSPLATHMGMWRIYSYPDPHGSPHSFASYDTQGDVGVLNVHLLSIYIVHSEHLYCRGQRRILFATLSCRSMGGVTSR
jgi:hypothetical protein